MDLKEQYEKLLRYCYMLTKDRDLAEDIVQDAYRNFLFFVNLSTIVKKTEDSTSVHGLRQHHNTKM